MTPHTPPLWLERILLSLLATRDRETVSGDLLEVYRQDKRPQVGQRRADFWYARQVLGFVPRRLVPVLFPAARQRSALALLCMFTAMCGLWLGTMDLYLRHPGYLGREWIAGTLVGQALLTCLALRARRSQAVRWAAMGGCLALFWLAGRVLLGIFRNVDLEGYVLLIALAITVQGLLTLLTLNRAGAQPSSSTA